MKSKVPKIAEYILRFFLRSGLKEQRLGDYEETFQCKVESEGIIKAKLWYWVQTLRSIPKLVYDSVYWGAVMFKNYFIISWRNLKKYKTFSLINISGLAIGMACCLLLLLYINSELSFDAQHKKGDRIFRVCSDFTRGDNHNRWAASNAVIAAALKEKYPEVEKTTRVSNFRTTVTIGDKQFSERFYFMDADVFDIFTYPFIYGNPKTALSAPYSIVLTQETAEKYFGPENPIGKTIKTSDYESLTITGVMENVSRYSTLRFNGICSFATLYAGHDKLPQTLTDWMSHTMSTFILLKEGTDYRKFDQKIKRIYYSYVGENTNAKNIKYYVFLQPLSDIYLRPIGEDTYPITYVYILSTVAIFVLLIACLNFMNLSTARATNRAKEVGIRKVLGANKAGLIKQFLSEAILLTTISIIIALLLVELILPYFSDFVKRDLMQDLLEMSWLIPVVVFLSLFVGLIAGSYPAFYLSKFLPTQVMQNRSAVRPSNINIRKGMIILQFTLSTTLIIGTILIMQQLRFLKSFDPGFKKDRVMIVNIMDSESRNAIKILEDKFKQNTKVIDVGAASSMPFWGVPSNVKLPEGFTKDNQQIMQEINIDADYLPTMGVKIVEGRNFSDKSPYDQRNSVIINETAVKKYGWKNPIGKTIQTINMDYDEEVWESRTVIGVVKDFYIVSLFDKIEPMFIGNDLNYPRSYGWLNGIAIKLSPGNINSTVDYIEKTWKSVLPGKEFFNYFLDETYDKQFGSIERSRQIFSYFTYLAIFIAVLGLLGMAMFTMQKRMKEMAIRKVFGSSVTRIIYLLMKELLLPVLIANIIAYPIAYYFINLWLQNFVLRMDIGARAFILSTGIALFISFAIVIVQAFKAAKRNPVDILKYE